MNQDITPDLSKHRKRVQYNPDGQPVLIQDTPGITIDVVGVTTTHSLEGISDNDFADLRKALQSDPTLFDNRLKALKLKKK